METDISILQEPTVIDAIRHWIRPGDKLLDVGCGAAQYRKIHGGEYVGLDSSTEPYRDGIPRDPDIVGDAARLPFEDSSFDAVMYSGIIYYFDNVELILREAARVVRPGGRLLIFNYSTPTLKQLDRTYSGTGMRAHHMSVNEWHRALKSTGWINGRLYRRSKRRLWHLMLGVVGIHAYEVLINQIRGAVIITAMRDSRFQNAQESTVDAGSTSGV